MQIGLVRSSNWRTSPHVVQSRHHLIDDLTLTLALTLALTFATSHIIYIFTFRFCCRPHILSAAHVPPLNLLPAPESLLVCPHLPLRPRSAFWQVFCATGRHIFQSCSPIARATHPSIMILDRIDRIIVLTAHAVSLARASVLQPPSQPFLPLPKISSRRPSAIHLTTITAPPKTVFPTADIMCMSVPYGPTPTKWLGCS
ncbi:hypothetical protein B0T17DRAFT_90866 [Bombardia bombarda]|uniref:Uncharacterized protein n=1 Tax=Bombardia bombarda TaxID=252184 RepID=A0AA39XMU0_9PEZI|nr:hypothetical protein B0T17DRAFT_90866 [Bombardia bombarda]